MMISTKGRYALRVMLDLAQHDGGYVPLKDIAQRQGISEKYLESIVSLLTRGAISPACGERAAATASPVPRRNTP